MIIKQEDQLYTAYDDNSQPIISVNTYTTTVPKGKYEEEELCTIDEIICISNNVEQQLTALKEIFIHVRDEFEHYPGIDNYFTCLDSKERALISRLIERGDIPRQLLMDTEDSIGTLNSSSKSAVKNLVDTTTKSRTGFSRSGFLPYNSILKVREPRSYAKERFSQLLRQMATQLYHFCCSNGHEPTEIQIMYFKHCLFISANSKEAVVEMNNLLSDSSQFKKARYLPMVLDLSCIEKQR